MQCCIQPSGCEESPAALSECCSAPQPRTLNPGPNPCTPVSPVSPQVTCRLVGDLGSGAEMVLQANEGVNPFEKGSVDEFEVYGLDVGRLSRLHIGHDNT